MNQPRLTRRAFECSSIRSELGGSLPPVLIAIAVGSILLAPFLAHVSSRMLATRGAEESARELYAVDSGIEFAIWYLDTNTAGYRDDVDNSVAAPLSLQVNDVSVSVESTALPLGAWTELADTLDTVGPGGAISEGGDGLIYALRGNTTTQAWRYNPGSDIWSDFAVDDTPDSVGAGGTLSLKSGTEFYALRGGGSGDAWEYDSGADNWNNLSGFPGGAGDGADITYTAPYDHLYGLRGSNTNSFRRYRATGGPPGPPSMWIGAPEAPGTVSSGGALISAGDYLYALKGGGSSEFWRFDPGAGDAGSWSTGGNDPADAPGAVNAGGALAWDGGDFIYALSGGGTTTFWRYSISSDSWSVMANTPDAVGAGGDLAYGSGNVYALQGNQTQGFWRFEITPPRYDIEASAGDTTITARVEIDGNDVSIIFWDIE